jgi:hypothetical protein
LIFPLDLCTAFPSFGVSIKNKILLPDVLIFYQLVWQRLI